MRYDVEAPATVIHPRSIALMQIVRVELQEFEQYWLGTIC